MSDFAFDQQTWVVDKHKNRLAEPPRYKVLLHNDHYTSMEFVVEILEEVFHHSRTAAESIMLQIHRQGLGCAGEYDREIAESKVATVTRRAGAAGFPLRCSLEKV
ncbi:MAG TPA: ATP-dependent Clp protease adaptor ClpS [Proteobacteria bacterium]|nr:ATP-dependent Clp protease adaptor ClpS [Pseudomonadota bacterium]